MLEKRGLNRKLKSESGEGGYFIQPAGVNTCIYLKKESLKLISLVRSGKCFQNQIIVYGNKIC